MARAIWSGSISFGLVNVPVKLYSAVSAKDVHFHQLEEGTGQRIKYKRVAEESGKEVPYQKIVKGYELDDGRMVIVTPDDLDAVAPEQNRVIEIEDFVALDDIDPVYFENTYYLAPDGKAAAKAYALLVHAMEGAGKVAVGRFVMRSKQYLAAIRPRDGLLVLETLYFADEVRGRDDVGDIPDTDVSDRELKIADQLIDSLTVDWDPERYEDTYREQVLDLIRRKAEGEEIVAAPAPKQAKVVDLMAALEASLEASKGRSRSGGGRAKQPDYDSMSKTELYDLAQDRDLPGRSGMTKDELADALREADEATSKSA